MSFLVVANWKMNGNSALVADFVASVSSVLAEDLQNKCEVVLCPPFNVISAFDVNTKVRLGAQNCFHGSSGCTGEVSARMLRESGCDYVILGHAERRRIFSESASYIKLRAESAVSAGLIPILCIGETIENRKSGFFKEALLAQCGECIPDNGKIIIAYEPVWAIGGSEIPKLEAIQESIAAVRSRFTHKILYGGSVNQNNVCDLLKVDGLSGVLVGGVSIKLKPFCEMIHNLLGCL